jgi:hypothetical protein
MVNRLAVRTFGHSEVRTWSCIPSRMFMKPYPSGSAGSDWDLCSVDRAVNHFVNAVKHPIFNIPPVFSPRKEFLRLSKFRDKALSREAISLTSRDRSNAGMRMSESLKRGA